MCPKIRCDGSYRIFLVENGAWRSAGRVVASSQRTNFQSLRLGSALLCALPVTTVLPSTNCQVPTAPGRGRTSCAYGRTYGRAWHMPGGGARGRWTWVRDATPHRSAGAEQSQKFRDPHPKGYTTNWRGIAPWWSNEGKGRTRRTAVCWQARTWPTIDLQVNK